MCILIWGKKIVGAGFHTRPELEHIRHIPKCRLTQIGNEIDNCIKGIGQYCKNVQINEYIIMYNHVHMLVNLNLSIWLKFLKHLNNSNAFILLNFNIFFLPRLSI